jgi:adenylate kinase
MIAPPGAGKGTQGNIVAEHFGVAHIASGDLLRDHVARGSDLGQQVKDCLDRGEFVPDEVVLGMVREAFVAAKATTGGYVLDGIPRTMEQARETYRIAVDLGMTAHVALHLKVEDDVLIDRLLARAAEEGRSDDTEDVIRRRLALYKEVTQPIEAWYAERGILLTVDADRPVEAVSREILTALDAMRPAVDDTARQVPHTVDLTGLDAAFGLSST